jgi:class 3 adenylate cyclase
MKYFSTILFIFLGTMLFSQSTAELERQLKSAKNSRQKMLLNYELGKAYLRSNTDKSIKYSKTAYDLALNKDKNVAAEAAYQVARGYNRDNNYRSEETWLNSSFSLAKQVDNADLIIKSVDQLSRLVIRKDRSNGHRKAYDYVQKAFDYFSKKGGKSITDFQSRFETQKAKLEADRRKLERERSDLEKEIKRLTSERNNLKTDNTVLTKKQRVLEKEKEQVEKQIEEKDEAIEEVAREKEEVKRELKTQEKALSKLEMEKKLVDIENSKHEMELKLAAQEKEQNQYLFFGLAGVSILLILLAITNYFRFLAKKRSNAKLESQNRIIEEERQRSDELLLNILPASIAQELKETGKATAQKFNDTTVLFADFKNFTKIAERLTPETLVKEIDDTFRAFDFIISQYDDLEKIKTIGDAYMVAGGLSSRKTVPYNMVKAAMEMQEYLEEVKLEKSKLGLPYFEARIGMHTGSVVAGVVGNKKFAYDIWGDTVNIASRMEANCEVGRVNMSGVTASLVKYKFDCEYRGKVDVKNKGMMDMYYLKK